MLNSEMKKRIDDARDILVGKIPVPSQQIEQITIALIYKFMSDIDKQDKELGGDGFFQGEYEQYSWDKVMDRKLGGQERLKLYSEGLDKLDKNPYLPQMFRDIFKNAYLPFKDPATLDMFLKQIDKFSYDHSEDLGDAFEYLLSTAGSQGDAGQFRTPRHIIDFIVSIVQPEFIDTVLDPACGTAGFLISAYKYILNQNKDKVAGDKLSLTQKKSLTEHFVGYDISPEMVKLSLVNMYLHNFGNPKIYEYDTLSDDSKWDNRFDCILANPPFMTPKGGIQPHNRFSIKASKSEVLFVDYMIEHLNPNGKAGIVVPEGIIFQSANAYKDLRKKMIKENYLWGVVSLPTGVFQPYSGVKTSILLFDKELAKKTNNILFVKVLNDGFDLGAQRKPINKNDLPKAGEILLQYKKDLLEGNEIRLENSEMNLLVSKEKIEENSEMNLSMDRYKGGNTIINSHSPMEKLGSVCILESGGRDKGGALNSGIPSIGGEQISIDGRIKTEKMKYISESYFEAMKKGRIKPKDILLVKDGATTGKVGFFRNEFNKAAVNEHVYIVRGNEVVLPEYLFYILQSEQFQNILKPYIKGIIGGISLEIKDIEIPIPPLEAQEKIVSELDVYQKIIDGAKTIYENYKPTIKINPDWEMVKLGEVAKVLGGYAFSSNDFQDTGIQVIKMANVKDGFFDKYNVPSYVNENFKERYAKYLLKGGDIVVSMTGTVGKTDYGNICMIDNGEYLLNQRVGKFEILDNSKIINKFLYYIGLQQNFKTQLFSFSAGGVRQANISNKGIESIEIPLPSLEKQQQIVAEIEKEEAMIESAKQLIDVFEEKIKEKIDEIRGK